MTDHSSTYPSAPPVPPSAPAAPSFDRHRRQSATFWGVMLIVLGAALMAAQFVPSVSWWMLWPLLIVVGGIAQAVTPEFGGGWTVSRVFEGLGTIAIGLVLLGNTTGVVAWTVWLTFLSMWPVLLIALGISIIGKGVGAQWLRVASRLLVWATLALAVYLSLTGSVIGPIGSEGLVLKVPAVGANGQTLNITIETDGNVPTIQTW